MNDAHLHLLVNHFPIIVPVVGLLVLIAGYMFKSESVKTTALGIFVLGALMTIPAMFTGEGAEEIAEKIPGITRDIIHHHEEMAEKFAFMSYFLGLLSLFGLWGRWKKKAFIGYIYGTALFVAVTNMYFASQAGASGGEVRHTEIRSEGIVTDSIPTGQGSGESEDHND